MNDRDADSTHFCYASLVFSNVFASVVSLLSDARIAVGLPSLRFLGPWLYAEGFKGRHAQLWTAQRSSTK